MSSVGRAAAPAGVGGVVGQRADADGAVAGLGAGVVALQGEGAGGEDAAALAAFGQHGRVGLGVVDDQRAVEADLDVLAAHGDVQREPLVVVR